MSEDQDQPDEEQVHDEAQGPTGGERLAQARREQQISVLEVAKELHLDEPKVRALERNDFDVLGAPVFAKGHLRKYAQLVGVNADDVFADYYRLTRSNSMPPFIVGRPKVRHELSPGPWIAAIILAVIAATAYWWFASAGTDSVTAPAQQEQVPDQEQAPVLEQQPQTAIELDSAADDSVVIAAALPDDEPAADEPIPEPIQQTPADGQIRLSVSFSGDCWTEIIDADGLRLFFNMGRNGQSVELSGTAPLSALFGNADNVSVRVNGSDYEIAASSRSNRTARLTIDTP